jgi:hypothetical protein
MSAMAPDAALVRADGKAWDGAAIPIHFATEFREQARHETDRTRAAERLYQALEMEHEGIAGAQSGDLPDSDDPATQSDSDRLADADAREARLGQIRDAMDEIAGWLD